MFEISSKSFSKYYFFRKKIIFERQNTYQTTPDDSDSRLSIGGRHGIPFCTEAADQLPILARSSSYRTHLLAYMASYLILISDIVVIFRQFQEFWEKRNFFFGGVEDARID